MRFIQYCIQIIKIIGIFRGIYFDIRLSNLSDKLSVTIIIIGFAIGLFETDKLICQFEIGNQQKIYSDKYY